MKKYCITPIIILLSGVFCFDFLSAREEPAQDDFWSKYRVIVERNIFSRNRGARPEREPTKERAPAPAAEKGYVLRGITQWNEVFIAFVENARYGATLMYRRGDTIADMTIKTITLDRLEVEKASEVRTIEIGRDLLGEMFVAPVTMDEILAQPATGSKPAEPGTTAATKPTGEGGGGAEDTDDILKKLMERRQKELQQ